MDLRTCVTLLGLLSVTVSSATAQSRWYAEAVGSVVLGTQTGLAHDCSEPHRLGFGQRIGHQLGVSRYAIEGTLRGHLFGAPAGQCQYDIPQLPSPPPDGSFTTTGYTAPLLTDPFVALDLRIRRSMTLGSVAPTISLGVGRIWQSPRFTAASANKPFLLAGTGVRYRPGAHWGISLEGEVLLMRSAGTSATATWAGGELQNYDHHGVFRHWLFASGFTLSTGITF